MKRLLIFSFGLVLAACPPLFGEAEIQRYLNSIEGFRFIQESETSQISALPSDQPFTAEILNEAGFSSYSQWRMVPQEGSQIHMEVFEILDSSGAFQLFSHWPFVHESRNSGDLDLPISSQLNPNEGIFWRGRFFFRITKADNSLLPAEIFTSIVNSFFESVSIENLLPVSITHLPDEERIEGTTRLYLGEGSLRENNRFPGPLLEQIGLSDRIEIAFAEYGQGRYPLFLVGYPTVALSKQYLVQMQNSLQGFFSEEGVYIKRTGVLIAIFIGPEDQAQKTLSHVNYQPDVQWLYEKKEESRLSETMTFLGLITQTILGIGVFLVLILGTGFSFGLVRYELIRRFPEIFRKEKMIRLNLESRPPENQASAIKPEHQSE